MNDKDSSMNKSIARIISGRNFGDVEMWQQEEIKRAVIAAYRAGVRNENKRQGEGSHEYPYQMH